MLRRWPEKDQGETSRWSFVTEQKGHWGTGLWQGQLGQVREGGREARRREGSNHTGVTKEVRGRTEEGMLGTEHALPAPLTAAPHQSLEMAGWGDQQVLAQREEPGQAEGASNAAGTVSAHIALRH